MSGSNILAFHASSLADQFHSWMNDTVLAYWRASSEKEADCPVLPPALPQGIEAFVLRSNPPSNKEGDYPFEAHKSQDEKYLWWKVPFEFSQKILPVTDPIRVRHDALFAEVRASLPPDIEHWTEIPNQYSARSSKLEPWFSFSYGNHTFIIGPRKRVYSLAMYSKKTADYQTLAKIGEEDETTNQISEHPTYGPGYVIHAWGKIKLFEYLQKMIAVAVNP